MTGTAAGLAERTAKRIGVVAFVGEHVAGAPHAGKQLGCSIHVCDVAWCEHQIEWAADDIRESVDLGRPAAARMADRLRFIPSPLGSDSTRGIPKTAVI
jgi:hypothetical protein